LGSEALLNYCFGRIFFLLPVQFSTVVKGLQLVAGSKPHSSKVCKDQIS